MDSRDDKFNDLFSSDSEKEEDSKVSSTAAPVAAISEKPQQASVRTSGQSQFQTRDTSSTYQPHKPATQTQLRGGDSGTSQRAQPPTQASSTYHSSQSAYKSSGGYKRTSRSRSRSPSRRPSKPQGPPPSSRSHHRRDRHRRSRSPPRGSDRRYDRNSRYEPPPSRGNPSRSHTPYYSTATLRFNKPTPQQIILRHTGGSHPIYPYQLTHLKSREQTSSSADLSKSDVDYLRSITVKARAVREEINSKRDKARVAQKQQQETGGKIDPKFLRSLEQRARESLTVASFFQIMNETRWYMFDDEFYILSRRWFDNWKGFVSFDYVLQKIVTEQRKFSDLSINSVILQGPQNPGEICNWSLLLEPNKYFNRTAAKEDAHFTPLREHLTDGKEFFVVPKCVWRLFFTAYRGPEIKRYSLVKNRSGQLHRSVRIPLVRVCLMRRGESMKQPKLLPLALRTTLEAFKVQVSSVFPQILSDWGHTRESIQRDMRIWVLRECDMPIGEFIQSYNNDIINSQDQSFNFPGYSLELRRNSARTSSDVLQIDEIATLLSLPNSPPGVIFIEIRRGDRPWIFNLDEYDEHKFYKSVLQTAANSHSRGATASPETIAILQQVPYLNYLADYMTDREYFGGQSSKDTFIFSYNGYWKHRNYIPASLAREFTVTSYPPTQQFYAKQLPQQPVQQNGQNPTQTNPQETTQLLLPANQNPAQTLKAPAAQQPKGNTALHSKAQSQGATLPSSTTAKTQALDQACAHCEAAIPGKNRGLRCQNCKSVVYCDQNCMKQDARFHDGKVCQELKDDYYLALKKKQRVAPAQATVAIVQEARDPEQSSVATDVDHIKSAKGDQSGSGTVEGVELPQKRTSMRLRETARKKVESSSTQTEEDENEAPDQESQAQGVSQAAEKEEEDGKALGTADGPETYCDGGSKTFSQESAKSTPQKKKQSPVKPARVEVPQRKRDVKRRHKTASKAPIVKFKGAMKQPARREPIVSDKPAMRSLAAELASSSDSSSDSDSRSEKEKKSKKTPSKSKKASTMSKSQSSQEDSESPDEEIKVDLKADKQKLSKQQTAADQQIEEVREQADAEEQIYRRDMFERRLGLSNLGNSCYINCIVQVLAHLYKFKDLLQQQQGVPDITALLKDKAQQKSAETGPGSDATTSAPSSSSKGDTIAEKTPNNESRAETDLDFQSELNIHSEKRVTKSLKTLFDELCRRSDTNQTIVNPSHFKDALVSLNELFRGTDQFDACEFVQILLEMLDTERHTEWQAIESILSKRLGPAPLDKPFIINQAASLSEVFKGALKQTITCQKCNHTSTSAEPFTILSLPIETEEVTAQKRAHIKVMYIFDDKYIKYDFYLKPGKYTISMILDKVRQRATRDRKELKSGRKTVVFADLKQQSILTKFFSESLITFNFVPGQQLTTYAFEVDKKLKDRLHSVNFLHLTKQEYSLSIRKYFVNPRIVNFTENESVRVIGYKIYKEMIGTLRQAMQTSIQALNFGGLDPNPTAALQMGGLTASEQNVGGEMAEIQDEATMKQNYEDLFINRKVDVNNMPMPPPYELFALYRDGKREKIDPRQTKKLGKAYDMHNLHRIDVEFPMQADFTQMKAAFDSALSSPPSPADLELAGAAPSTDLQSCIRSFAKPETLTGQNKWRCDQCDDLQDAKKTLELSHSPELLFVHLKRFKFIQDTKTGQYRKQKLDTLVKFDRKLKLHKLFLASNPPNSAEKQAGDQAQQSDLLKEQYVISSVVHHQALSTFGEGGHYITYCFNEHDQDWCRYDDGSVRQLPKGGQGGDSAENPSDVMNKDAYLLIYRKKDKNEVSRKITPHLKQQQYGVSKSKLKK